MGGAVVRGTGDKGDQRKGMANPERPGRGRGALLRKPRFLNRERPPPHPTPVIDQAEDPRSYPTPGAPPPASAKIPTMVV